MLNSAKETVFKVVIRNALPYSIQNRSFMPYIHPNPLVQPRATTKKFKKKHINPKFRFERSQKMLKIDLPNFHEKKSEDMSPDEIRVKMKERGIQPHRPWNEKPYFISSTGMSFDPYIPPEADGKASLISKEGAKQKLEFVGKKGKSMMAIRKIREYDDDFELKDFVEEAQRIYIDLHHALARFDEKELHKLATEKAYPLVVNEVKYKTLRWAFHGSIEPPKVVHIRQTDILTKENIFAQATVRFHTQQTLAVYDRFGRLLHGSEHVLKDVLEYVVFEKHISNVYGLWRIHDKIIPPWMNLRPTSKFTFKVPPEEAFEEEPKAESTENKEDVEEREGKSNLELATA